MILERVRRFLGTPAIHPIAFYTGKIACAVLILWFILQWLQHADNFISLSLFLAGWIILLISWRDLGESTRIGLPRESTELKIHGIYRLSRNPMYVALDLISIVSMFYLMEVWSVILALYCIVVHHRIILEEEKFLYERFSDQYHAYCENVRRYL